MRWEGPLWVVPKPTAPESQRKTPQMQVKGQGRSQGARPGSSKLSGPESLSQPPGAGGGVTAGCGVTEKERREFAESDDVGSP